MEVGLADDPQLVFSRRALRRNSQVALVVGCVLTLANQSDVILCASSIAPLAVKLFFDFSIPSIVSSISAAMNSEPH